MVEVRELLGRMSVFSFLFLFVVFSFPVAAQDSDRDKEKEEHEKLAPGMVSISGSMRCSKPNPSYSIDVPDRPGHSLVISKRACTWTEPLVVQGEKTKEGIVDAFTERMEERLHVHGFEVDTLEGGEKLTMQTTGQVNGEKGPVDARGRWSFMRGTGKFKGIRGGGTYEGKLDADDVLTLRVEGVYESASMAGGKTEKEQKK